MEHFDWIMGFVLPYINFALFVAMFVYFFKGSLSGFAKGRRAEYEKFFEEAKKAREQAEAETNKLNTRLANLDGEIAELKKNTLQAAEAEASTILEEAKRRSEHMVAEADRLAEATIERARDELRAEIMTQVQSQIAGSIASEVDQSRQAQLVDSGLSRLTSMDLGGSR